MADRPRERQRADERKEQEEPETDSDSDEDEDYDEREPTDDEIAEGFANSLIQEVSELEAGKLARIRLGEESFAELVMTKLRQKGYRPEIHHVGATNEVSLRR